MPRPGSSSADSLEGTLGRIAHHLRALRAPRRSDGLRGRRRGRPAAAGVRRRRLGRGGPGQHRRRSAPASPAGSSRNRAHAQRPQHAARAAREHRRRHRRRGGGHRLRAAAGRRAGGRRAERLPPGAQPFDREEVELVERFATMAALAYDSARQRETLRRQVRTDGLTGLLNHRACHERLSDELAAGRPVGSGADRPRPLQVDQRRPRPRRGRPRARRRGRQAALGRPAGRRRRAPRRRGVPAHPARRRRRRRDGRGGAGARGHRRADAARAARWRPRRASRSHRRTPPRRRCCSSTPTPRSTGPSASGRGQTRRYSRGELRPRPEDAQRAEIEALLARGTDAVRIVLQPVVELATGRAGGWEALARFDAEPARGPDEWFAQAHQHRSRGRSSRRSPSKRRSPRPAGPRAPSSRSTSPRGR